MISNTFLFYGPKGCGKSSFAGATFNEFSKCEPGWITVEIKKARLLESPIDNLNEAFSTIKQYEVNGILIEDIDQLLDSLRDNHAAKQILIEGLREFGKKKLIIATTRKPNKIDNTILSEFDAIVPFYYPPEVDRCDILRVHTRVKRHITLDSDVELYS